MPSELRISEERARYWDRAYAERGSRAVSWYQPGADVSLELVAALDVGREAAVIDVGGGASVFVDKLGERGFVDVSVLDVSEVALAESRRRLASSPAVQWLHEDILTWRPQRRYDLWHDRAVLHFLVDAGDRAAYLGALRSAVCPGGFVVLATFAPDGPNRCSGLPVERYSASDLAELLGPSFVQLEARREEHHTPGGRAQPFTWVAGRLSAA